MTYQPLNENEAYALVLCGHLEIGILLVGRIGNLIDISAEACQPIIENDTVDKRATGMNKKIAVLSESMNGVAQWHGDMWRLKRRLTINHPRRAPLTAGGSR